MIGINLIVATVITIIFSLAFIGGWLLFDRKLSWTFLVALITYIPMVYYNITKDELNYLLFSICFFVLGNLYLYDQYFIFNIANRRGRR